MDTASQANGQPIEGPAMTADLTRRASWRAGTAVLAAGVLGLLIGIAAGASKAAQMNGDREFVCDFTRPPCYYTPTYGHIAFESLLYFAIFSAGVFMAVVFDVLIGALA